MLTFAIFAALVSAVFGMLSKSKDGKRLWAVVCLALVAMICYILIGPLE